MCIKIHYGAHFHADYWVKSFKIRIPEYNKNNGLYL
jgi:hypothetical protein